MNAKFTFHNKYGGYKSSLPPYVLEEIQKAIEKKYKIREENEDIDAIFAKYGDQYTEKREYDRSHTWVV
jgi:hypothetical protein